MGTLFLQFTAKFINDFSNTIKDPKIMNAKSNKEFATHIKKKYYFQNFSEDKPTPAEQLQFERKCIDHTP